MFHTIDENDLSTYATICENNPNFGVKHVSEEILFYQGKLRDTDDIRHRLNVILSYNDFRNEVKERIKFIVGKYLFELRKSNERAKKLKEELNILDLAALTSSRMDPGYKSYFDTLIKEFDGEIGD